MELYDCPVCLTAFDDPHLIPSCGHTFCKRCLDSISLSAGGFQRPRCPTCREYFRIADVRPNYALRQVLTDAGGRTVQLTPAYHLREPPRVPGAIAATASLQRGCTRELETTSSAAEENIRIEEKIDRLRNFGLPPQLARVVEEEDRQIGLRVFLLDNSGSTAEYDGKYFVERHGGIHERHPCRRWDEIKHMALQHGRYNAAIGTPCEFVLLNGGPPPGREGVDFVVINASKGDTQVQLASLQAMLDRSGPNGRTPMTQSLNELYNRIRNDYAELAARGQRVVLVVATDGVPTDGGDLPSQCKRSMVSCLKRLTSQLRVFVVIRLATDEDDVVQFYNEVDDEFELDLEVLDDMEGEANEIRQKGNGWLTYSPLLHRLREGGTFLKLFDLLDERRFTEVEVAVLAQLLVRGDGEPAFPSDPGEFVEVVGGSVAHAPRVWDPLLKRLDSPIKMAYLRRAVIPLHRDIGKALSGLMASLTFGCSASCIQDPYDLSFAPETAKAQESESESESD